MTDLLQDIHILQNGVPRSGNVWLFYLTRHLLEVAGTPVKQFITGKKISKVLAREDLGIRRVAESDFLAIQPLRNFYTILDVYRWPVEDLDQYVAATTQVASHSPWNSASEEVYGKFSYVLYIIRDPRDVALSMSRFAFTPFNRLHRPDQFQNAKEYLDYHFNSLLHTWVEHVRGHLSRCREQRIQVLFYEQLVADLPGQLRLLADDLGLSVSKEQIDTVARANSFGEIAAQQPHHTHQGVWGGWRSELSRAQIRQADALAGPLLELLGYPPDARTAAEWSPASLRLRER